MTKQQYRDARKLIEDEAQWCQEHFCLDASGQGCKLFPEAGEPFPVQFCGSGAVARVRGTLDYDHLSPLHQAAQEMGYDYPSSLNDATDHAMVLRMFDRAIELAKEA